MSDCLTCPAIANVHTVHEMLAESIVLFGTVAFLGWGVGHIVHRAGRIPDFLT